MLIFHSSVSNSIDYHKKKPLLIKVGQKTFLMQMNFNLYNSLIDSLDLRLCTLSSPTAWLFSQSQIWQAYHKAAEGNFGIADMIIELPELGYWSLKPFGHRPYQFILTNPEICDIRIWSLEKWANAASGQTGQLYISFRSKFLQFSGLSGVNEFIQKVTSIFFETEKLSFIRVSRADLACDIACEGFAWTDLDRFISRSRYREVDSGGESLIDKALGLLDDKQPPQGITRGVVPTDSAEVGFSFEEFEVLKQALSLYRDLGDGGISRVIHDRYPQTLYFGRFSSPIYARIYNKLKSLDVQDKHYMKDVWAARGWDGETGVWRIEFSLSGDFLKNAIDFSIVDDNGEIVTDLRNFDSFLAAIPQIWQYCTYKWLRFVNPRATDSNHWRYDVAPFWESVQKAFDSELLIIRKKLNRQYDDKQIVAQLKGLALTIAARRSHKDELTDDAFSIVVKDLWEFFDSPQFLDELRERRQLLGIDDLSDTLYSREIRSIRMNECKGS